MEKIKKHWKLWVFVLLVALALGLNAVFGWSAYFTNPESLPLLQQTLQSNLALAALLYIGLTALGCVVLALPGIVFAIAAGLLFGPVWGTVLCSLATTLGAALSFLLGRYFLQGSIRPLVMKNKHLRRLLLENSEKNALFLLLITRLVPLFPYNLQNFAYGITDIRFWPYTLYSFLFMLPGTAAYTLAAAGVADAQNRWLYLGIALGLLAAVSCASLILRKKGEEA